jgi:hypothetical protein
MSVWAISLLEVGGSLRVAAQLGNIDALYDLIRRDAKVLDKIDELNPFVEIPLHTAVYAGHTPAVCHGDHELKALSYYSCQIRPMHHKQCRCARIYI